MKLRLHALDTEIREVEARIARERLALDEAISGCSTTVRNTVTSPTTLLALAGTGFVVGKLLFGRKRAAGGVSPTKTGMLGLLTGVAGTAISMIKPGSGAGTIARWALDKFLAKRSAAKAARQQGTTDPRP